MESKLYQDLEPIERRKLLEEECIKEDSRTYIRSMDDQEREEKMTEMAELNLDLARLKKKLDDFRDKIKEEELPIKNEYKRVVKELIDETVEEEGKLFIIPDYDTKEVGYYDVYGRLISQRTMKPEERQLLIHHQNKIANGS